MYRRITHSVVFMLGVVGLGGCPSGSGGDKDIVPPPPTVDATVEPDNFLLFDNTQTVDGQSRISSEEYAQAYYDAVDPFERRTTLAAWKAVNGFDNGVSAHATFRDTKDLGYGRDMYARQRADGGIAVFVDNYVVQATPGDATRYGPLNLQAAQEPDRDFLFSTNAIEFSPVNPTDPSSDRIVKMFTFGPPEANGRQARRTFLNADGRGEKSMPTVCFACHGGKALPLNTDGSFPLDSLKSLKMNILEPTTFEFSESEEEMQQGQIKIINQLVHQQFVEIGARSEDEVAKWNADFAIELVAGPYDNFSAGSYDADFVPEGWRRGANRPDGVELLYREVVLPHCIECHAIRGTNAGELYAPAAVVDGVPLGNAINFSSYEKFISYNDEIIDRVYRRANMPLSLLNYTAFWRNPSGPPTFLASFLAGFDVLDQGGNVVRPGRPVPLGGADRTVTSPAVQDASASLLADSFSWAISESPVGAQSSLANAASPVTTLSTDTDGQYVLTLSASNAMGSASSEVTLTVDSMLRPAPEELTFAADIRTVLADPGSGRSCVSCHRPGMEFPGMAVFFDDTNPGLYRDVLERVNLIEPENSLLLTKPTALQHGGGIVLDRGNASGKTRFNTLLNWIRNGAPCGSDPAFCN
ncbi:MAG: Ig-like domain-containing protein [Gammaproteobacteria bacterium]|nr:Ig-like domain-containing protein [Gammaproteobacteria bacterium]NNF59842.1 hypothetical protein [Gammaproteobacteria bacterium]NNM21284.1 hypothetical protein [Gammaproteobacteria bacterium]